MLSYTLRRLLSAIPTIFIIVTVAFFLIRVAPGGPFDLERPLQAQVMENLQKVYHLDKPLWEQYLYYLGNLARGDFGPSFVYRDFSVAELLANGLPVSIQLGGLALLLALIVGTTLGVIAAVHQNKGLDTAVMSTAMIGITIPNFVMAPLLTLIFAISLGLLPAGGWAGGSWQNMILPVVTLALPQTAIIARLTRGSMVEM
ncbi:MAG: ABC transporter permease subunit, partial [Pseudomonadota bacterium]